MTGGYIFTLCVSPHGGGGGYLPSRWWGGTYSGLGGGVPTFPGLGGGGGTHLGQGGGGVPTFTGLGRGGTYLGWGGGYLPR